MITVVNKKTHIPTENDVYIGRGSVLGNPYTSIPDIKLTKASFKCETREESINKFYEYILEKITNKDTLVCAELNRIWKLVKNGVFVNLVCYCTPQLCHGNIIKKIIEDRLKEGVGNIDGVHHVNVYSKGNTLLGKLLSNFAETNINVEGEIFASVESWWYWMKMKNLNETFLLPIFSVEQVEEIKNRPGFQAKEFFRKLYKDKDLSCNPTKEQLKKIYLLKLEQHPQIKELLLQNELPLRHYYIVYGKQIEPKEFLWTARLWQEIKNEL